MTARLDAPELYVNRELSWLDFNQRVLELAEDESVPLLERVRFLAIYESNLDEFFMVRVAGLHEQVDAGLGDPGPDGLTPSRTIDAIAERARELDVRHARAFERAVAELAAHGVRIVAYEDCTGDERAELDARFEREILPVLTPLAVGPGRPFPYISNLSLSLGVVVHDSGSGERSFARVKVPKEVLPRFVRVADATFVLLEDLIAHHLDRLFPGMEIAGWSCFRVIRDADFTISDEADDLLQAVETELRRRRFGEVVRLEVSSAMDAGTRAQLVEWLGIEERQLHASEGPLDLADLREIYAIEGRRELRERPWAPLTHPAFAGGDEAADAFAVLRERDVLVHHPYDSFATSVERFVHQAVADPDVLAIKITVYRTSDDSALVPSLIEAAERGKQAVCVVELKARFDERRNIRWARALEEAGAHVVHGLPGLKTHAKAVLVVRREGQGVRRYVHVGTGNYNAKTARTYSDLGFFSADEAIAADVAELFNSLTGLGRPQGYRKAIVSPERTRDAIVAEIARTAAAHRAGEHARIKIKVNALVDAACVEALYAAAGDGVPIDLNVRGICALRPGVPGVSESVRVVSVVGRFLEHARIYAFERGEERLHLVGSPDLMPRNLDARVELLVPVEDERLARELDDVLDRSLADDTFAWDMRPDGTWERRAGGRRSVQAELMQRATERAAEEA